MKENGKTTFRYRNSEKKNEYNTIQKTSDLRLTAKVCCSRKIGDELIALTTSKIPLKLFNSWKTWKNSFRTHWTKWLSLNFTVQTGFQSSIKSNPWLLYCLWLARRSRATFSTNQKLTYTNCDFSHAWRRLHWICFEIWLVNLSARPCCDWPELILWF